MVSSRKVVRRKPADARKAQLLKLVQGGITEPQDVAAYMGVSTNMVLKYANGMVEVDVVPEKVNGTGRIKVRLKLAEHII